MTTYTLGADRINAAIADYKTHVNEYGWDSRPLTSAIVRKLSPDLLTPRDAIWLRRYDEAIARLGEIARAE